MTVFQQRSLDLCRASSQLNLALLGSRWWSKHSGVKLSRSNQSQTHLLDEFSKKTSHHQVQSNNIEQYETTHTDTKQARGANLNCSFMLLQGWGTDSFNPIVFQGMAILQDLFTVAQLLLLGRKACRYTIYGASSWAKWTPLMVLTLRYRLLSPDLQGFQQGASSPIGHTPLQKQQFSRLCFAFYLFVAVATPQLDWVSMEDAQSLNNSHDISEMLQSSPQTSASKSFNKKGGMATYQVEPVRSRIAVFTSATVLSAHAPSTRKESPEFCQIFGSWSRGR